MIKKGQTPGMMVVNMIIKDFYMKEKNGEYIHYSWDDEDGVYWADDDEIFYYEIPQNAILTLK